MVRVDRRLRRPIGRRRAEGARAALAKILTLSFLGLALGACAGGKDLAVMPELAAAALPGGGPRIVTPARPLQCVAYARAASKVQLRGDAGTWWRQAAGRYERGRRPAVGAVLVLGANGRSRGHLAVVTALRGAREIVVDHANWLNRGRIHLDTPVRDVSAANDWSAVQVWYTPGRTYGARRYPAHGFIYPRLATAAR